MHSKKYTLLSKNLKCIFLGMKYDEQKILKQISWAIILKVISYL